MTKNLAEINNHYNGNFELYIVEMKIIFLKCLISLINKNLCELEIN